MNLYKKSLKSISINDSKIIIQKKFARKTDIFELSSISNIYIKRKIISSFYFFDSVSFALVLLTIVTFNQVLNYSFFVLLLLLFFWSTHLIFTKSYYIHMKFKNDLTKNYFFSHQIKYEVLEKVKIVRGKLTSFNFKAILFKER